ncbi:MAG TPA: Crp/Fnr family transcriptional regulator [Parapedobacter sp.]|nr:Crp/Fnr family transcriptional regulator [Parapedobacter sp.]
MDTSINALQQAHNEVLALFSDIYPVSEELASTIRQHSRLVFVPRRTSLLHLGEVCKSVHFIISGAVRTYYIDKEGNETTSWLLFEGDLAISVYSFFGQRPSFEAMETLEDCSLLILTHEKLSALYRQFPEFNYIGRTLTEQYYIRSEAKANALRKLSAKERYLELLANRPHIVNRVSLGHIASFLGITSSTLSRIRASI